MIQKLAQFYKKEHNLSFNQEDKKNEIINFSSFDITIKCSDQTTRENLCKLTYQLHKEYVKTIKTFEQINQKQKYEFNKEFYFL